MFRARGEDPIQARIVADVSVADGPGIPDGMKVDARGRAFCTGGGEICVFEPDGTHIGTIRLPETAVNLAFGGDDLRTLFVTAVTSIYSLRVKTPGQPTRGIRRGAKRDGLASLHRHQISFQG